MAMDADSRSDVNLEALYGRSIKKLAREPDAPVKWLEMEF